MLCFPDNLKLNKILHNYRSLGVENADSYLGTLRSLHTSPYYISRSTAFPTTLSNKYPKMLAK